MNRIGYRMSICFSLFACVSACLVFFSLIAWTNALWAPHLGRCRGRVRKPLPTQASPLVSVLVPARNEAHQITACVTSLLDSSYPRLEVLVADDQSSDGTGKILENLRLQHPRGQNLSIYPIEDDPPPGWLGKVRACQVLSEQARGDVLIFCDADVLVSSSAIANTLRSLWDFQADALTCLPRQYGGSLLTQAIVAAVTQLTILVSLPLCLIPRLSSPAVATGNGQWFAWRRKVYDACEGHRSVRASRIEDVELGRLVKRRGYKLLVTTCTQDLRVQMYRSLPAARHGFRKNLFALVGNSWVAVVAISCLILGVILTPWLSYLYLGPVYALAALGLQSAILIAQRQMFGTAWSTLAYLPMGVLVALGYLVESAYWTQRRRLTWKGRAV